jgi:hypothetical protein
MLIYPQFLANFAAAAAMFGCRQKVAIYMEEAELRAGV